MSEENVEIVRRGIDMFNAFMRGEVSSETAAKFLDPQIEGRWHAGRTMPDEPQHLRGVPAITEFAEQFRSVWEDMTWEPLEFIEAPGEHVLIPIRASARGREGGVPVEFHFFWLWTLRDGRVSKIEVFRHRADALEAAGLRE